MSWRGPLGRIAAGAAWLVRCGLLFGVAMAVYSLTLGGWASDRLSRAEQRLHERERQVHELEATAARMDEFRANLRRLEERLQRAARALPEDRAAWLAAEVSLLPRRTGVERARVARLGDVEPREFLGVATAAIEARGSLVPLGRFADALWALPALELLSARIEPRGDAYAARFDVRVYEWLPGAPVPSCERSREALYAAAELAVAAVPVASRLERGDGWLRRRASYRVTKVFKRHPRHEGASGSWTREGGTISVVRSCVVAEPTPAGEPTAWPPRGERCRGLEPELPGAPPATPRRAGAAAERLLLLRMPHGEAGWELVEPRGLLGVCDAPLPPADEPSFERVRSWTRSRDGA